MANDNSTRNIWNNFFDSQKETLTAKNGHRRQVLGVYLSGSYGREMNRTNSDLDLIIIQKEDRYDWLTGANLNKSVKINDPIILDSLADALELPIKYAGDVKFTPKVCDIKYMGLKDLWKLLIKMDPNTIDNVLRGPAYVPSPRIPEFVKEASGKDIQPARQIIKNLNKIDLMHLNQYGYIGATLGMANNIKKRLDKDQNLKEVDLIRYFTELFISNTEWKDKISALAPARANYHSALASVTLDDSNMQIKRRQELLDNAEKDLDYLISILKDLELKIVDVHLDQDYRKQQRKAQNTLTDLFMKNMF